MPAMANTILRSPEFEEDEAEDRHRYLKFFLGTHAFAVPLTLLTEILRLPVISRVPMAPPSLLGLANLRGSVLPVLDLRPSLNVPITTQAQARILVLDLGRPVGCLVDRVANVMVADSEAEIGSQEETTLDKALLSKLIKSDKDLAFTLNFDALLAREFPDVAIHENVAAVSSAPDTSAAENENQIRLVCFTVADQDYALPIDRIPAILAMPEKVVLMPKAHAHVFGVIRLQQELLPVFYLSGLLGLPTRAGTPQQRVVVTEIHLGPQAVKAGLVVDKVSEVIQVSPGNLRSVPGLLGAGDTSSQVSAICSWDHDERLFGILSPEDLFAGEQVQSLLREVQVTETGIDHAENPENAADEEAVETRIAVLRLLDEEFALPITQVEEILRVPQLAPIPKAPDFVLGMMNLRGAVIPVMDPRRRLHLPENAAHAGQRIVVVSVQGERTGILVDGVSAILPVDEQDFETTPEFMYRHAHLVQRVAHLADGRMLLMLDLERLVDANTMQQLMQLQPQTPRPRAEKKRPGARAKQDQA